jgi:hypothetical protein
MKRLGWIVATCVVLAAGSARADKLPRKLVIAFDRCTDSFVEAGYAQSREFALEYECKQVKSGYACAPTTGGSALSDLSPRKLALSAKASAIGIDLTDSRGASIRLSLRDGAGRASLVETISTDDKHGSRFCSGDAAISARKLADARQQPTGVPITGIPECDLLIRTYISCKALPESVREAFTQNADAWKQALEAGGDAARTQLVESCKQATEAARQSLQAIGC